MKSLFGAVKKLAFGSFLVVSFGNAQATLLSGDFQSGDLSNWTMFTTGNGTLGSGHPTISNFDVAGSGVYSSALGLSVGYLTPPCSFPGIYCLAPTEGGGIRQTGVFSGGLTLLRADVAVTNSNLYGGLNGDGGTFSLFLDGLLLDSYSVEKIAAGTVQRGHLNFTSFVSAGSHTLEVLVTRHHSESLSLTQYIDNVTVSAVPAPTTASLVGLGMLALVTGRKKRNRNTYPAVNRTC